MSRSTHNSIVKIDALEQAMGAYQQANNQQKVEQIASQILTIEPNNVRALAIVVFIERGQIKDAATGAKGPCRRRARLAGTA